MNLQPFAKESCHLHKKLLTLRQNLDYFCPKPAEDRVIKFWQILLFVRHLKAEPVVLCNRCNSQRQDAKDTTTKQPDLKNITMNK